jgi:hypothetical protein
MPIRINLLAEQQEAEEARRRDPVKRGVWVGASIIALAALFSVSLQFRLNSARNTLVANQARLDSIEPESKEVRADWQRIAEIEKRSEHLLRYSTNRFYWALALDALQRVKVDSIRIVSIESIQSYATNSETHFRTNIVFPRPPKSKWRFWSSLPQTDVLSLLSNQLAVITHRPQYASSKVPPITKISLETNDTRILASVEIIKPATATERITLTIEARDYSEVPGRRIDEFSYAIGTIPYFKERLETAEGQGVRLKDRTPRPELDPQDPLQPNKAFVPFTLECKYQEKVRAND